MEIPPIPDQNILAYDFGNFNNESDCESVDVDDLEPPDYEFELEAYFGPFPWVYFDDLLAIN